MLTLIVTLVEKITSIEHWFHTICLHGLLLVGLCSQTLPPLVHWKSWHLQFRRWRTVSARFCQLAEDKDDGEWQWQWKHHITLVIMTLSKHECLLQRWQIMVWIWWISALVCLKVLHQIDIMYLQQQFHPSWLPPVSRVGAFLWLNHGRFKNHNSLTH